MRWAAWLTVLLLLLAVVGRAQGTRAERVRIASWNVENLFDTEDDPDNPGDDAFTPRGWRRWTEERYSLKLKHLAEIVAKMNPDVLCLIEIENRRVVEDLADVLRRDHELDYPAIMHQDSEDFRGIDVAMIARYAATGTNWFCGVKGMRDVLSCDFERGGRPFTVILNHWKSQLGEKAESDAIRSGEARAVRDFINKRLDAEPGAAIVVIGDFNDAVDSPVLTEVAGFVMSRDEVRERLDERLFFNLVATLPDGEQGTFYYAQGRKWNMLDMAHISPGMLDGVEPRAPWRVVDGSYMIFKSPAQVSREGGIGMPLPFRRVRNKEIGDLYVTGYSDHFPICLELEPNGVR